MDYFFPVIIGFVFTFIFVLHRNGHFKTIYSLIKIFKLMNQKITEYNITPELIEQFSSILDKNDDTNDDTNQAIFDLIKQYLLMTGKNISTGIQNKTHMCKTGRCMHIYYFHENKEYMLTVPYNIISSVDMLQYQVDAIYENGDVKNITQQPGIPYLFNCIDLGCKSIKAINHETDVYHEYKDNVGPNFCQEICDS